MKLAGKPGKVNFEKLLSSICGTQDRAIINYKRYTFINGETDKRT